MDLFNRTHNMKVCVKFRLTIYTESLYKVKLSLCF